MDILVPICPNPVECAFYVARGDKQVNFNVSQLLNPAWAINRFTVRLSGMAGLTNLIQVTTDFDVWSTRLHQHERHLRFHRPDLRLQSFSFLPRSALRASF